MIVIKPLLYVCAVILSVLSMGDFVLRILHQFWKGIEPYIKGYAYFIVVYATLATVYATVASVAVLYVVVCKTNGKETRMKLHEVPYPTTDMACGTCDECREIDYCERHPLPGKHV